MTNYCQHYMSYVNNSCTINDSWFSGANGVMNGTMNGGIFRDGKFTKSAKFNDVKKIEYEKINYLTNG